MKIEYRFPTMALAVPGEITKPKKGDDSPPRTVVVAALGELKGYVVLDHATGEVIVGRRLKAEAVAAQKELEAVPSEEWEALAVQLEARPEWLGQKKSADGPEKAAEMTACVSS